MHAIDSIGRARGMNRRPFPTPLLPVGLLLVAGTLAASHASFPLFPLLFVALFLVIRGYGRALAWRARPPAVRLPPNEPHALPSDDIGKEKELLRALEQHGEITAARVALETSLSVFQAEEMLSRLASGGHVRVKARDGRLAYSLGD